MIDSKLTVSQHITAVKCKITHKQIVESSHVQLFSKCSITFVLLYS